MNSIKGKHICITGRLEYGVREDVFSIIRRCGGLTDRTVRTCTDYLVEGDISRFGGPTNKLKKANELGIRTITEKELFELIYTSHTCLDFSCTEKNEEKPLSIFILSTRGRCRREYLSIEAMFLYCCGNSKYPMGGRRVINSFQLLMP